MNQMLFRLRYVDEHARDKLKWVDRLAVVDIVAGLGLINKEPRFRMITKSRQIHWRALQVVSEAMEPFSVAGIDGGVIVNVGFHQHPSCCHRNRSSPRDK